MNYFGHATVACWRTTLPTFVLGAMLPDFERMSGTRLPAVGDDEVQRGVRWHHLTDAVFHDCATFGALCQAARTTLREAGLARGPCMAIAHIGIELLLDGLLLGDAIVEQAYLRALHAASALEDGLPWRSSEDAERFAAVRLRLLEQGPPIVYRDPYAVAERLHRILAMRPRLAFDRTHLPTMAKWADATRSELHDRLPTLLEELRAGLEQRCEPLASEAT